MPTAHQLHPSARGLVRPVCTEDEWELGYLRVFMRLNGLQVLHQVRRRLAQALWPEVGSVPNALAAVADMGKERFVRDHSLVPLWRMATETGISATHADYRVYPARGCVLDMAQLRDEARYCVECVQDDLRRDGISRWKRSHQLPGQLWCTVHECPLHSVRRKHSFLIAPSSLSGQATSLPKSEVRQASSNRHVSAYLKLQREFLTLQRPLSARRVERSFRRLARSLPPFRGSDGSADDRLYDLVRRSYPAPWLENVLQDRTVGHAPGPSRFKRSFSVRYPVMAMLAAAPLLPVEDGKSSQDEPLSPWWRDLSSEESLS
jgi:hypothetical protein